MRPVSHQYRLREAGGLVVAQVFCPTDDEAQREIQHYALTYSQDGPVTIEKRTAGRRWKPIVQVSMGPAVEEAAP